MTLIPFKRSLPQPAYSAIQVLSHEKRVAQSLNLPLFSLMQKAGQSVFEHVSANMTKDQSMLIVCGKGNNGGDGFVVAKLAVAAGINVHVLCTADQNQLKGDARQAFEQLLESLPLEAKTFCSSDLSLIQQRIKAFQGEVIVDAIFGIGFSGELSTPWLGVIEAINCHQAMVVSVDVPSGLDANTGSVCPNAVVADETITFIVVKQGLLTGQASVHVGILYCVDLGIGIDFIKSLAPAAYVQGVEGLPKINSRFASMHKGSIGLALTVGGNESMPGAIKLSSEAALKAGAALVAVCCHKNNQAMVFNNRPELMLAPHKVSALADSTFIDKAKVILIGPGLGQNDWALDLFECVTSKDKPLVVDADALRLLSQRNIYRENWVLTPHPGEAASLLNVDLATIENDRFQAVRNIAQKYGGICVLKGAGSLISDGETVWINQTGNSGMASGGMGDVLSGIISALILQSSSLLDAVRLAVSIHGQAADMATKDLGPRGLLASDLLTPIRKLVNHY
jgi:ADP-dependent NAD(P)H-hydrate dehydratase / NAD(P)H-hydrate epimerase